MKIADQLGCALLTVTLRLLGSLSLTNQERMARWMGRIWFALDRRHREIALKNLTAAFAKEKRPSEIRRMALACFTNLIRIVFEVGWSLGTSLDRMPRFFTICGLSHYTGAMKRNRGVLLLTLHLGNWELLSVVAAMAKIPAHVLYRPLDVGALDLFFNRYRSRFGARLIPNTRGSMRNILKALKKREVVAVLMDQNVDWYEGVFVDFFGESACTNQGLALVALTTEAPVVPVFLARHDGGFMAEFLEEIPLVRTGDRRMDLEENTRRYTRALEGVVRRFPQQWLWVHQRWKTRPWQPWPRETGQKQKGRP